MAHLRTSVSAGRPETRTRTMNRREFLQSTSLAGLAAALGASDGFAQSKQDPLLVISDGGRKPVEAGAMLGHRQSSIPRRLRRPGRAALARYRGRRARNL